MPFITNDFNDMLVDDDDYYKHPKKYKHYVVARRLFISSKTPFSDEYLREKFKKYGPIESTKILESKKEGFVTFECDRHACLAYNCEKDKCKEKKVRVDSTWHQPDEGINVFSEWNTFEDNWLESDESIDETIDSEAPSPLLSLDDNTLFDLFDRCDNLTLVNLSQTCSRLQQLLKGGHYCFPNQIKFHFESDIEHLSLSLVDVKKIFLLMGRHFEILDLWFDENICEMKILSYIQIIEKHCQVEKIQDMTFGVPSCNIQIFTQLGSILKNLTTLRLSIGDVVDVVDFTELCPNLKKIILWDASIVKKCLTKQIPTLQSFCWKYSWDELLDELDGSFIFFENNRQLTIFECINFNFENLQITLDLVPNIENLTIHIPYYYRVSTNDITTLENFKNLRKLTLGLVEQYFINKGEIIDCCGRLKKLSELKLYFPKPETNQDRPFDFSKKFSHLERLDLYGVQLNEKIVIDFVRVAAKIKTIHLHECNVYATESVLMQLETIAKSSQRYRNGLSLFIGNNLRNNFVSVNDRKIKNID